MVSSRESRSRLKNLLVIPVFIIVAFLFFYSFHVPASNKKSPPISLQSASSSDSILAMAFSNHESNLQISGQGVVTSVLPDDKSGTRHQRFIIMLASGQTLLIAHNIDIAPRIRNLQEGDLVQFFGEYEWNEKGGVIHYTHRAPKGGHMSGWLEHKGERYE
jgi:hypothetical protein